MRHRNTGTAPRSQKTYFVADGLQVMYLMGYFLPEWLLITLERPSLCMEDPANHSSSWSTANGAQASRNGDTEKCPLAQLASLKSQGNLLGQIPVPACIDVNLEGLRCLVGSVWSNTGITELFILHLPGKETMDMGLVWGCAMPVQPCGVAVTGLYLGAGQRGYLALSGVMDRLGTGMRELQDGLVGAASSPSWEAAKCQMGKS